jgi:excinuclease ABC subunit C
MMKETLDRRFSHSVNPEAAGKKKWPLPNLIIIDGGKGQLSSAVEVMAQYGLQIPIMGLAKRIEEIFRPGNPIPLTLPTNSIALFLLQRIRDEAHRFGITYHRKLRSKSAIKSALDDIPGLGPNKKKLLLNKFGTVAAIRKASLTEIAQVTGPKLAQKIKASL